MHAALPECTGANCGSDEQTITCVPLSISKQTVHREHFSDAEPIEPSQYFEWLHREATYQYKTTDRHSLLSLPQTTACLLFQQTNVQQAGAELRSSWLSWETTQQIRECPREIRRSANCQGSASHWMRMQGIQAALLTREPGSENWVRRLNRRNIRICTLPHNFFPNLCVKNELQRAPTTDLQSQ